MISEAKNYGYKNRQPAGRSLVEGRNHNYKLTIWAQDLKPQTLYSVFLLFPDDKRYAGVAMGSLPVDDKGKGEIRKEFDNTALGTFSLADFAAIAVIAKENHGVTSPLCGYKDSPVSWRHGFYEYTIPTPAERKAAEKPELPQMPNVHNLNAELDITPPAMEQGPTIDAKAAMEIEPETGESALIHSARETDIEQIEACPHVESIPQIEAPASEPVDESYVIPDIAQSPRAEPITAWNLPKSEMAKAFRTALDKLHTDTIESAADCDPKPDILSLFETREYITPFQKQARQANWISFTPSDPVPPPSNKPLLFDDPFIQTALAEYHHLILGLTTDKGPRRYIIGVPGVYSQEAKLKAKKLGFTQFKCTRDALPAWGEAGYWLMFTTVC